MSDIKFKCAVTSKGNFFVQASKDETTVCFFMSKKVGSHMQGNRDFYHPTYFKKYYQENNREVHLLKKKYHESARTILNKFINNPTKYQSQLDETLIQEKVKAKKLQPA